MAIFVKFDDRVFERFVVKFDVNTNFFFLLEKGEKVNSTRIH